MLKKETDINIGGVLGIIDDTENSTEEYKKTEENNPDQPIKEILKEEKIYK